MSSKITMIDVAAALEKVRGAPVLTSNQCHDLAQALNIAAPVVERQESDLEIAARLVEGKTVSVDVSTGDHDAGNRLFCKIVEVMEDGDSFTLLAVDPEPNFDTAPPELAELQATIAQLTSDLLDKSAELNAIQRQRDDARKQLARDCDDIDSVLRLLGFDPEECRTDGGFLKVHSFSDQPTITQLQAEIEQLKGGQGEPVAYAVFDKNGNIRCWSITNTATGLIVAAEGGSVITPLFASQPAPVSVVLPERKEYQDAPTQESYDDIHSCGEVYGWNACLDKVKELNQ
mgnify:CR=1 FL=1